MIEFRALDDLAARLSALVPPGVEGAREDLTQTFRATLQSALGIRITPRAFGKDWRVPITSGFV